MPIRETAPAGAPGWLQITTSDSQKTRNFYSALFGWTVEGPNEALGGYFNFKKNGVYVAGGAPAMQEGVPDLWSLYLATNDIDESMRKATEAGAVVHVPVMTVVDGSDELGSFSFFSDPYGGAMVGFWQAGSHQGFGAYGEDGTPGWFELHTREYDKTLEFYRDVVGWQYTVVSDDPAFRYCTFTIGDGLDHGGIVDDTAGLPADVPSHWTVYFAVADTSAAITKLESLGGTLKMRDPETPYGDLAIALDTTGAEFKLVGPNAQMPMAG